MFFIVGTSGDFTNLPKYALNGTTINIHATLLSINGSALRVYLLPSDASIKFTVYIKYMGFPNESYYDWMSILPLGGDSHFPTDDINVLSELRYTAAPFQSATNQSGLYRIGIQLAGLLIRSLY